MLVPTFPAMHLHYTTYHGQIPASAFPADLHVTPTLDISLPLP